jgi:hypothetical protein
VAPRSYLVLRGGVRLVGGLHLRGCVFGAGCFPHRMGLVVLGGGVGEFGFANGLLRKAAAWPTLLI